MTIRSGSDRCPSLLRPFIADDGALIRVRVPGGQVPVSTLQLLLEVAQEFGEPTLQLTSRANIQLRGLPAVLPESVMQAIESTGLLPSPTHEQARNILASPLARNLDSLVNELDRAICADDEFAQLSGRFLFAIADRSGSVLTEPFDLAYQLTSDSEGRLLTAGLGMRVQLDDAVAAILDRARLFLAARSTRSVWNIADLPSDSLVFAGLSPMPIASGLPVKPGLVGGDLVVGVPLGLLTGDHLESLARVTSTVVLTPWRSLVIRDIAEIPVTLVEAGLITRADSPWIRITSCVGAPSCRRAATPTMPVARQLAAVLPAGALPVHVVGCDRMCGHPSQKYIPITGAHDAHEALAQIERAS